MPPTAERLRALKPQIEALAREFGVLDIRVFGSVARGTAVEGSDVDLLVRIETCRSLLDLVGFEQEVGDLLKSPVDVVTERALHPRLKSGILREARPI